MGQFFSHFFHFREREFRELIFQFYVYLQSRFQFMSGLALFCAVLMVLLHASIHYLMQRFAISMLVYLLMGAGLRVLRPDFEHR